MDSSNKLLEQIKKFWTDLPHGRKIALSASMGVLLTGLIGLVVWSNQVEYEPLYARMDPEQVPSIVEALKAKKEVYRLTQGGNSIEVPKDRVLELRMSLATAGVIKDGTTGFELFDKNNLGVTNFVEQLNYQRALQGELARSIGTIEQVDGARVHLVMPRQSLFVSEEKPPTASIILKLKSGQTLDRDQVRGIVTLVSTSIEGLRPENVTVSDTRGRLLTDYPDASSSGLSSSLLEFKENYERTVEGRIEELLEKTVGAGHVVARVNVDLDMQSQESTSEEYDPSSQVARSEKRESETRSSAAPEPKGIPGTGSNLPENTVNEASATSSKATSMEKTQSTINYEVDRTTRRTVKAPGEIKRLSVAVLVDGTYVEDAATEKDTSKKTRYVPRNSEEMKEFERLVRSAAGALEDRGDVVSVTNLPFEKLEDAEFTGETTGESIPWEKPVRYGMVALAMLLGFLLLRPVLRRAVEGAPGSALEASTATAAAITAENLDKDDGEEPPALAEVTAPQQSLDSPASPYRQLSEGARERMRQQEELINVARGDLENTVQTIRDWLRGVPVPPIPQTESLS